MARYHEDLGDSALLSIVGSRELDLPVGELIPRIC